MGILDCDESDPEEEPQEYKSAPTGNQPAPIALRIRVRHRNCHNSYVHYFYTVQ